MAVRRCKVEEVYVDPSHATLEAGRGSRAEAMAGSMPCLPACQRAPKICKGVLAPPPSVRPIVEDRRAFVSVCVLVWFKQEMYTAHRCGTAGRRAQSDEWAVGLGLPVPVRSCWQARAGNVASKQASRAWTNLAYEERGCALKCCAAWHGPRDRGDREDVVRQPLLVCGAGRGRVWSPMYPYGLDSIWAVASRARARARARARDRAGASTASPLLLDAASLALWMFSTRAPPPAILALGVLIRSGQIRPCELPYSTVPHLASIPQQLRPAA
ncbi:uncharacterized protein PSFLO_07347 [Pseudozyma flocculosa]|uniref:Uncharacterized protein n=1 Tax=Pseudozyma flocculosa TaxID=84751 RepID=A0A5C3FDV5_9BASI|nr:uncharacterized protein PSFLO_07347 [Pseudozyma flocculosa]